MCEASGLPIPDITWTKNDVTIKANGTRLVINDTKESDSGVYECTATNLAGSKSERSVIKIEGMFKCDNDYSTRENLWPSMICMRTSMSTF